MTKKLGKKQGEIGVMRPREGRLDNEEHSWLFQSDWEETAEKLVLRIGKAGNHLWRPQQSGWELDWSNSKVDIGGTGTLAVIVAGDQVRDEREMTAEQARRAAGRSTKGRR